MHARQKAAYKYSCLSLLCYCRQCCVDAGVPYSLLGLVNNSCVVNSFRTMQDRFARLYKRKFFLHHYLQYMEEAAFTRAVETVACLNDEYLARTAAAPMFCDRQLKPVGMHFL